VSNVSVSVQACCALKDRQAVVYGRASSCRTPIVVRLNDAVAFDAAVWEPRKGELARCVADEINPPPEDAAPEEEPGDPPGFEDDIPF
jgi:hypothetical protein